MAESMVPRPGPGSSAREQAPDRGAIADWLARAHPRPREAVAEWANRGVSLLPLGVRFDAVRVPAARIHSAVCSEDPKTVAAALDDWLCGPVVRDLWASSGDYYVLVAPEAEWNGEEQRLGKGSFLVVPRIGNLSMITHWVVPPRYPGNLCSTARLRALLTLADVLRTVER
ncbi:hypothetical protein GCM10010252_25510 [Streptomyces aureoverticillatus]|nr:hypothetical protein GCM10010252_25510 [Streptomyces aureoverticillatus]